MVTMWLGFVSIIAVFVYSLMDAKGAQFLNLHAIVVVCAGTVAILLMLAPTRDLASLWTSIRQALVSSPRTDDWLDDLVAISRNRKAALAKSHPLMVYAQELWEQGIGGSLFKELLEQKSNDLIARGDAGVQVMRSLAKYPPALGMAGTVVGIVTLFSGLSSDTKNSIGPALALAMTATFYGLVIANAVIMPLADRLQILQSDNAQRAARIVHALSLIEAGEPVSLLGPEVHDAA